MITASSLFLGKESRGKYNCYYCGCNCGDEYKSKKYVKPTFTNRDLVKYPSSEYVCKGCIDVMESKYPSITLADGEVRKIQRIRQFCWVLTKDKKIAATKAHIWFLRETVLNPPEPPFVICLADSGQKQILFRAPVALDRENFDIMLEDDYISINLELLKKYMKYALPLIAVIGKVAISEEFKISQYIKVEEYYGNTDHLEKWLELKDKPLAKLAAWLSPNQKEAQIEYQSIKCGKIQTTNSGTNRPKKESTRVRTKCDDDRGGQLSLFPS